MVNFNDPQYFLFILSFPLIIWLRHVRKKSGAALWFSFNVWKEEGFRPTQRGIRTALFFSHFCFYLGLLCFIFALAGPVKVRREKLYLSRGADIMVVLDESPSMSAKDFPPENRFESAKDIIYRFVEGRENDPVGLVTFGENAVLRVPPTLDYETLKTSVNNLELMDMGDGTSIGMGMAVAVLHLKYSTASSRVMILLTDGVNNAGEIPPLSAATAALEMGIKIYTIGIGGEGEVDVEYKDPETGKVYTGKMRSGFDDELLIEIAEMTGGKFFRSTSPGTLETVFQSIDSIEASRKRTEEKIKSVPLYRFFLTLGLIFITADFLFKKTILGEIL